MELTNEELERLVVGEQPKARAVFYEQAVLNVQESKRQGRRVYDKKIYIQLRAPGVRDNASYEAQKADIIEFHKEYQDFLRSREDAKLPGIEIIPNLDLAHLQELRDYGILTIKKLAESNVPSHLEYAKQSAIVLNKAFEEQSNAEKESSEEAGSESRAEGPGNVHEIRGREHADHVGRPPVEESGRREAGRVAEGHDASGREHHRQGLTTDDWSVEFKL